MLWKRLPLFIRNLTQLCAWIHCFEEISRLYTHALIISFQSQCQPVSGCLMGGAFTCIKPALFPLIWKKNNSCLFTFFRIFLFGSGALSWKDYSTNLYPIFLFNLVLHYSIVPNWAVLYKSKIWPIIIYLLESPKGVLYLAILRYLHLFKILQELFQEQLSGSSLPCVTVWWTLSNTFRTMISVSPWEDAFSVSSPHVHVSITWNAV